jgi:hypothetical protein
MKTFLHYFNLTNKYIFLSFPFWEVKETEALHAAPFPAVYFQIYISAIFFRQRERDRLLSLSSLFVVKEN